MTVEEVSNCLEQIKNIILNSNSWTGEAKTIVEKCFNTAIKNLEAWGKVKEEIKFIQEAEIQVYGKANWNFSGKCLEIVDKHLSELEV